MKTTKFALTFIPVIFFVCSCATTGLYQWHGYDQSLYTYLAKPETAEKFRVDMENAVAEIMNGNGHVAPGFCAEIGTLYLQKGDRSNAIKWYQKERDAWPESATFMDALIKNLQNK